MEQLRQKIQAIVVDLFNQKTEVELTRPDEQFGDFATNAALKISKNLQKNPREVAEQICERIKQKLSEEISECSVAGPGFINLRLTDDVLVGLLERGIEQSYAGKVVVAEYSDPNPFKILHAGHLYTSVVGDSIANLLEAAGGEVHRVNFGGDVGLHVAKTMWSVLKYLGSAEPKKLDSIPIKERSSWLADRYIEGTNAYDEANGPGGDIQIKLTIINLNRIIYDIWSQKNGPILSL